MALNGLFCADVLLSNYSLTPDRDQSTAYVMDGMATMQMVKTGGAVTLGTLAEKYWEIFTAKGF